MKMTNQRLRNLTTGRLHTEMGDISADLGELLSMQGQLTGEQLPNALIAVVPLLRERITDQRFWNGEYDPRHTGETEFLSPDNQEIEAMQRRFAEQPLLR